MRGIRLSVRAKKVVALLFVAALIGSAVLLRAETTTPPELSPPRFPTTSERSDATEEAIASRNLTAERRSPVAAREVVVEPRRAYVRGQVLVAFDDEATRQQRGQVLDEVDGRRVKQLPNEVQVVSVPRRADIDEVRLTLTDSSHVRFAEPNFVYEISARPNDPYFTELWGLENTDAIAAARGGADIDAPAAWDVTTGDPAVTVGVIDSGVAYDHPDLNDNIWANAAELRGSAGVDDDNNGYVDDVRGWDFVQDDADPLDQHGHGSHVAGTIGAEGNNGSGIAGVNWDVSIMPLRALDASGLGSTADIAAALTYAARAGADVVNASLSGPNRSQTLESAIVAAGDTLFVVAAGNAARDNDVTASYPCNYPQPNVVCVAATGRDDRLASFSNYGATSVDLAAPGTRILSTVPSTETLFAEGFDDLQAWQSGGSPTWSLASDASGSFVTDSATGSYPPAASSDLTLQAPVVLAAAERCSLAYAMSIDTESRGDVFAVEVADGDSWRTLSRWSGSTSGHWISEVDEIPFQGAVEMRIRFRLEADGDLAIGDGVRLDDVKVACVSSNFDDANVAHFSGTSMAAPHVAGVAALALAAAPEATVTELSGALLAGADAVPELIGKVRSGARLDADRSLQLLAKIEPLEQEPLGPPPSPEGSSPGGEEFGSPPEETPSPGSPSPEQTAASPQPSPSPSEPGETRRGISLRLKRHLVAVGRVIVDEGGDERCRAGVEVRILRGRRVIATAMTTSEGRYRARLRDRTGRYQARLSNSIFEDGASCSGARSKRRRHVH